MAKKVTAGLIGLVLVLVWLLTSFLTFPFFVLVFAAVSALGVYEIEHALGIRSKAILIPTMLFTAGMTFYAHYATAVSLPLLPVVSVYFVILLTILVIRHEKLEFKATAAAIFASLWLACGFASFILLRDAYKAWPKLFTGKPYGVFFMLLAFFCSWLTDALAYFSGSFFGKHKMCPKISPNKTIEGAVGGVLGNTLLSVVMLALLRRFFSVQIGYVFTVVVTLLLSTVSIFGDLAASVIKRQSGIKDFGNLIPGTGGMMDRFDSSMFVFPLLYAIVSTLCNNGGENFIFT